jgi:hypothetical protein
LATKYEAKKSDGLLDAPKTSEESDLVPILPKVTIIGLQIFVTSPFYIFVSFNQ